MSGSVVEWDFVCRREGLDWIVRPIPGGQMEDGGDRRLYNGECRAVGCYTGSELTAYFLASLMGLA